MKQIFTILWVEDNPSIVRVQKPAILRFLDGLGYDLHLLHAVDKETFESSYTSEPLIDIIVTDQGISEKLTGLDVIQRVRQENKLTDILFYSAKPDTFEDKGIYSVLGHYGLIRIVEGKDVEDPLKELIAMNLQRYKDIIYLRGFVISRCVDLEVRLNEVIACYFKITPDLVDEFHNSMLEGGGISMNSKKFLLSKIIRVNGWSEEPEFRDIIELIRYISKQRNLLAHSKRDSTNPSILISSGRTLRFDRDRIIDLLMKIYQCEKSLEKLMTRCSA
jgi:hypothetical protein